MHTGRYEQLLIDEKYQRQWRDDGLEDATGILIGQTLYQAIRTQWRFIFSYRGNTNRHRVINDPVSRSGSGSKISLATQDIKPGTENSAERNPSTFVPIDWMVELGIFRMNVNLLCHHAGSEVDELDMPRKTINNLRKFASNRNQALAPLLEENAKLNKELASYKRINAALQIRRTIEKLVSELPETPEFDMDGSGPKWQKLWAVIWADAGTNLSNPFHKLWTDAKGQYARNDYQLKGRALFGDMSNEIHGYDRRDFDYEHFDPSTRGIANVLRPETVDDRTGEVDWKREIRKYPVTWPASDNLALSKVSRLTKKLEEANLRVEQTKKDLQDAKDEEEVHRKEGAKRKSEREADRLANEAQDSNIDYGGLYRDDEET